MEPKLAAVYLWFMKFGGPFRPKNDFIHDKKLYWDFLTHYQTIKKEFAEYHIYEL